MHLNEIWVRRALMMVEIEIEIKIGRVSSAAIPTLPSLAMLE
jgi:hypothetical protein